MKTYLQNLRRSFQEQKSFRGYCLQCIGAAVFFIMCSLNTHLAKGETPRIQSDAHVEITNKQ